MRLTSIPVVLFYCQSYRLDPTNDFIIRDELRDSLELIPTGFLQSLVRYVFFHTIVVCYLRSKCARSCLFGKSDHKFSRELYRNPSFKAV